MTKSKTNPQRRRAGQLRQPAQLFDGLIVDNFAGGGGASEGIEMGLQDLSLSRCVDIAINHDADALAMHAANHPHTRHIRDSVWSVNILRELAGKPVSLAWFSPDCTFFSKARGAKPIRIKGKQSRGLAWVVIRWARVARPDVIMLENVEEFESWGPLIHVTGANGEKLFDDARRPVMMPDHTRAGETFRAWVHQLRSEGYVVEWRQLRACDYGIPTIRKRLFLIARRDGRPIVWPQITHGDPRKRGFKESGLKKWEPAGKYLDYSLPCPSIFLSKEEARPYGVKRPLAEASLRRIAAGVARHVIETDHPYVVGVSVGVGGRAGQSSFRSMDQPAATITGKADTALVSPTFISINHGDSGGRRYYPANEPVLTITKKNGLGFVSSNLAALSMIHVGYGERKGQAPRVIDPRGPLTSCVGSTKQAAVCAWIVKHYGGVIGVGADTPGPTTTTQGTQNMLGIAALTHFYTSNTRGGQGDLRCPAKTFTTSHHQGLIMALAMPYYSSGSGKGGVSLHAPSPTLTTSDRLGLINVVLQRGGDGLPIGFWRVWSFLIQYLGDRAPVPVVMYRGEVYLIVDLGLRMFTPRELALCQGFPADYVLTGTKSDQVKRIGNSVCPGLPRIMVRDNMRHLVD